MTELPFHYDITITVDRDGGDHPNPAEFAAAAEQAASARAASVMSAHTAEKIISCRHGPGRRLRSAKGPVASFSC
jgi:hypothetical protein